MVELSYGDLLRLKRWNTPTVYNGWEQITNEERTTCVNIEETKDYMPHMGPMVGYAVTVICEPSNAEHQKNKDSFNEYFDYVAEIKGPKIVVVQDLDKPRIVGSFWGEVNANNHRSLGCVGTITDGAIRDMDEMMNAGFKAIASRLCVGHAYSWPVRWGCEVDVFGCKIKPGQLIHADKHGFLVIPHEDKKDLLEATSFMDANECNTLIKAGRDTSGKTTDQILKNMNHASLEFSRNVKQIVKHP